MLSTMHVFKYDKQYTVQYSSVQLEILIPVVFVDDIQIEDMTRRREDITFIFEWWKQYFTNAVSE
jgi:hypothetical protein